MVTPSRGGAVASTPSRRSNPVRRKAAIRAPLLDVEGLAEWLGYGQSGLSREGRRPNEDTERSGVPQ
jgi:hypothetical protein